MLDHTEIVNFGWGVIIDLIKPCIYADSVIQRCKYVGFGVNCIVRGGLNYAKYLNYCESFYEHQKRTMLERLHGLGGSVFMVNALIE